MKLSPELRAMQKLADKYESPMGVTSAPFGIVVEQEPRGWRSYAVFTGCTTGSSICKTATEARAWALAQTYYRPTITDVCGDRGQWSAE